MRILKFRFWHQGESKMYEGKECQGVMGEYVSCVKNGIPVFFHQAEGTVMQFINRTDKHEKDIYECDLVCCKRDNDSICEVISIGHIYSFKDVADDYLKQIPMKGYGGCVVLGDVFRNPELV